MLSASKFSFSYCTGLRPALILIPVWLPFTTAKLLFALPFLGLLPITFVLSCAFAVTITVKISTPISVMNFNWGNIFSFFVEFNVTFEGRRAIGGDG